MIILSKLKLLCYCFMLCSLLTNCVNSYGNYNYRQHNKYKKNWLNIKHKKTTEIDGPPLFLVNRTIKPIQLKFEPMSRYGNPDTYSVYGKTYKVLKTSKGYKRRGIASWYGRKFHRKLTSSGDQYDMYAMTAAHKTLPLPSYIKVKNLNNGRVAVVKVNDRGPFKDNRILDLSYAAAAKLGILTKGLAPVEIEALQPKNAAAYYIQAGAFNSKQRAILLQRKLLPLTTSPVFIEKYKQNYVVKVGPFAEVGMTEKVKNKLAVLGIQSSFSMLQ